MKMRKLAAIAIMFSMFLCSTVQTAELQEEFSYGINYAWKNYAGDFGGIAGWAKEGVASDPEPYRAELRDMAAHGIKVVRWWVWPEFWTDAISFSSDGSPLPLAQSAIDDALKALELADEANIRIMFCLFSFDGFRPTRESYGITMTGYKDIVIDTGKRKALMDNIIQPFAQALQSSPHRSSLHSWDVINEPEWAISGANKYGDPSGLGGDQFDPNSELEHITHDQMEVFLGDTIKVLRAATPDIPISIGSAALKWASAWKGMDVDFYQTHIYDWVNQYWPYSNSPADFGLDDKPLIMGEYPVEGLDNVDHETMLESWLNNGYAGAIGWDYRVTHSSGASEADVVAQRNAYLREYNEFASTSLSNGSGGSALTDPAPIGAAGDSEKELPSLSKPGTPVISEEN
jgi:hypothetical protein